MRRSLLILLIAGTSAMAQSAGPSETGSISGVVTDAATGAPVVGVRVFIPARGGPLADTTTDAQGRYTLSEVRAGRRHVRTDFSEWGSPLVDGRRIVSLGSGQELRSIDFVLQPEPSISGKVVDDNDEPLPGVEVVLLGREYFLGGLRYFSRFTVRTNDQGEYRIVHRIAPGTGWLLLARQLKREMNPISDAPEDPKQRRLAMIPTYYPSGASPEGGTLVMLRPGEQREGGDIRMLRLPSYCLEAQADIQGQPGELSFWIHQAQPSFGLGATGGSVGVPSGGRVGPDGKIRVCGLHRGDFRLSAFSGDRNFPDSFGTTLVSITDRDVKGVTVTPQPRLPLSGQVVWAGEPPDEPVESEVLISVWPVYRTVGGFNRGRSSVPGEFSIQAPQSLAGGRIDPLMDEYSVRTRFRQAGSLYLKDVTYVGTSILHKPFYLGSAMAGAELRVIVDHDGGILETHVADGDGEPVGGASVLVIPKAAKTVHTLAATRVTGETDQNGEYTSPGLAPGAYYVLATRAALTDHSPETISALFGARLKAEEVEIEPNDTVQLTLEPTELE